MNILVCLLFRISVSGFRGQAEGADPASSSKAAGGRFTPSGVWSYWKTPTAISMVQKRIANQKSHKEEIHCKRTQQMSLLSLDKFTILHLIRYIDKLYFLVKSFSISLCYFQLSKIYIFEWLIHFLVEIRSWICWQSTREDIAARSSAVVNEHGAVKWT